jgi:hypothetical protein
MKNLFVALLLTALTSTFALAETQVASQAAQFRLNKASPNAMQLSKLGDKVVAETVHTLRASYSFAVQGGRTSSSINLIDVSTGIAAVLPKGAIITHCAIDVVTTPTSGGASNIAIGSGQAANDLKAALAVASYTGLVACVPVGTVGTSIKLTADRTMTMRVDTNTLIGGKFYVIVQYVISSTT